MYQTIGHQIIPLYAQCMDIPLYRNTINGTSIRISLDYDETTNDEVEDLFILLSKVKKAHPDIQGVSVGAILSNYQRIRVENVCQRLGLTSISYLWQRNQSKLLEEMIHDKMDCILVKVAALGLKSSHLGKYLKEMQGHLENLNAKYGLHVCGEGNKLL